MYNRGWERFGEEVLQSVQDAVDSGDFSRLNQTITDAVNSAVGNVTRGVRDFGDKVNQNIQGQRRRYHSYGIPPFGTPPYGSPQGGPYGGGAQYGPGSQGMPYERDPQYGTGSYGSSAGRMSKADKAASSHSPAGKRTLPRQLYTGTAVKEVRGIILAAAGFGGAGLFLFAFIGGIFTEELFVEKLPVMILCIVLSVLFGSIASAGMTLLGRVSRFKQYVRALGGREYCDIKNLEQQTGRSAKFLVKDLQKMIWKGWFKQGHLDEQKTCLITSNDTYQQYMQLVEQTKQRHLKEQETQKQREEDGGVPPEVRRVIEAGEEYIRQICACNAAIPGEEISEKISRIEMLVDQIFARVQQAPELVSDLHRMMDYYLPTTVKLLKAYEELDAQPVQGENIVSSKREIEKTLDTLNIAFEKILNDLFQDAAWDLSADISALHTILAQEGLTEDSISEKK